MHSIDTEVGSITVNNTTDDEDTDKPTVRDVDDEINTDSDTNTTTTDTDEIIDPESEE